MRCVLAHRKLAKHITKCSGDAGAATRGRRRGGGDDAPVAQPLFSPKHGARTVGEDWACCAQRPRSASRAALALLAKTARRPAPARAAAAAAPAQPATMPSATARWARTAYKAHRTIAWSARAQCHGSQQSSFTSFTATHRCAARIRPGEQVLQQHGSRLLPGREPWEAGTGRLDLEVQNGTVPEVQLRWGVVIWDLSSVRQSGSRLHNQLLG